MVIKSIFFGASIFSVIAYLEYISYNATQSEDVIISHAERQQPSKRTENRDFPRTQKQKIKPVKPAVPSLQKKPNSYESNKISIEPEFLLIFALSVWFNERSKINEERLARIKEVCAKYPQEKRFEIMPKEALFLNHPKVIGCTMCKVGSTSMRSTFKLLRHKFDHVNMVKNSQVKIKNPAHKTGYKKFIIVREPMERLASTYNDKMIDNEAPWLRGFRSTIRSMARFVMPDRYRENSRVSFDDFLSTLIISSQHTGSE